MAIPKVFIASTCYDLKHIRSNLKYLIESLGYEPILSEYGQVFYNPEEHTHDSCLSEVDNCHLFVLIIGGRYGGKFKDTDKSITNKEYEKAFKNKIPIFTLIEQDVYAEHHVYLENKNNSGVDINNIKFPSVDTVKIFDFIDEVRKQSVNNAIQPFANFIDIEDYIKNQFAGLFFSFLTKANEEKRVSDIVEQIFKVNEKIEFLSSQLLRQTGSDEARVLVELYSKMIINKSIMILRETGHKLDPIQILLSTDLMDCSKRLGEEFIISNSDGYSYSPGGYISKGCFSDINKKFNELKLELDSILRNRNMTVDKLQKYVDK
jgi:hypothetical protein